MSRETRAGQTIYLRTQFKDDLDDVAEAEDVYVHIFDPDATTYDLSEAYVVSGSPTYLGQGIFEYEFAVPSCGPDGTWHDYWLGDLTCQQVAGILDFEVTTSGFAYSVDNQLYDNDIIQVTLASGIQATDGTNLSEEYDFEFMTTINPNYSSVRKVKMEVGAYVSNLTDDVIQMAILDASLEADVLTFATTTYQNNVFLHARFEYTSCAAAMTLMTNVGSLLLRSKTLADLHVEYDTDGLANAIRKLDACMENWKPQIMSGGAAKASKRPMYVVKGISDPDRPSVSRSWEYPTTHSDIPAANSRAYPSSSNRRKRRTYISPASKKKWW